MNVKHWARYVDDIFCVWSCSDRQLNVFLNFSNSLNAEIQFTKVIWELFSLNYLDLTVSCVNNSLSFDIHRKSTCSDTLTPLKSKQSMNIKLSPFLSFVHRLFSLPLNKDAFNKELLFEFRNCKPRNAYDICVVIPCNLHIFKWDYPSSYLTNTLPLLNLRIPVI